MEAPLLYERYLLYLGLFPTIFRAALNDALAGRFYSSPGLDGFFLTGLNAAATSASLPAAAAQALLAGPMRLAAWAMQGRIV